MPRTVPTAENVDLVGDIMLSQGGPQTYQSVCEILSNLLVTSWSNHP